MTNYSMKKKEDYSMKKKKEDRPENAFCGCLLILSMIVAIYFAIHWASSSSPDSPPIFSTLTRSSKCQNHPESDVKFYCKDCKETFCAECGIEYHNGHKVVKLETLSESLKDEISSNLNKAKLHDENLSRSIKVTEENLASWNKQAEIVEKDVRQFFESFRKREAELIAQVEEKRQRKEKELMSQKIELQSLLKEFRVAMKFSEELLAGGNSMEIAGSHKSAMERFQALDEEMKNAPCWQITEAMSFSGGKGLKEAIMKIGTILVEDVYVEKPGVVISNPDIIINQQYSFDLFVVNKDNKEVAGVPTSAFQVKIDGPSKGVKATVGRLGKEGKLSVSFALTQLGEHRISVFFKRKPIQGSPFMVTVLEDLLKGKVDYDAVGDQPSFRFGSEGKGDGQLDRPFAVGCNSKGEIIVADTQHSRIQVFDGDGQFMFKFGSFGTEAGQFNSPYGVTVNHGKGRQIVVADTWNHRVQIFDQQGKFLRAFGSEGNGDGQFNRITGIVVDQSTGNYFATDRGNFRVQVFDSNGRFIRKFGSEGAGNGQFNLPWGIGFLSNGKIVVSDHKNHDLQIFDSNGNFVQAIKDDKLRNPVHLFVDVDDNILVADYHNQLFHVFKANGERIKSIGTDQLSRPSGICVDNQGRIVVSEDQGNRISIW